MMVSEAAIDAGHRRRPPAAPRTSTATATGRSSRRSSRLYEQARAGRRADRLRGARAARRARGGRRPGRTSPARRRRSRRPATPATTRRSSSRTRCCGGCSAPRQQIQQSVHERDGEPQRARRAGRARCSSRSPTTEQAGDFRAIDEILHDEIDKLEELSSGERRRSPARRRASATSTTITGGFQPGNLIVLAARPVDGQERAGREHRRERRRQARQAGRALLARDVGDRARPALHRLAGADPGRQAAQGQGRAQATGRRWCKACNELEQAPLWIDDSSDLGLLELRAKARRLHAQEQDRGGLGLVIVDYLQLMRADDPRANRVEQVGQISRGLKILARELERAGDRASRSSPARPSSAPTSGRCSPTCASRRDRAGRRPRVLHLPRRVLQPGVRATRASAELIIAKHRNGPVGTVRARLPRAVPEVRRPGRARSSRSSSRPARARRSRTSRTPRTL